METEKPKSIPTPSPDKDYPSDYWLRILGEWGGRLESLIVWHETCLKNLRRLIEQMKRECTTKENRND